MYRKYCNVHFFWQSDIFKMCKVMAQLHMNVGSSILHNCKIVVQTHTFATCQLTTAKIDSFEVEKKWDSKSIPTFLPLLVSVYTLFISTHFSYAFFLSGFDFPLMICRWCFLSRWSSFQIGNRVRFAAQNDGCFLYRWERRGNYENEMNPCHKETL